jgi:predicted metal-dependent peptidase
MNAPMNAAAQKIEVAKAQMMLRMPWFATLLLHLRLVAIPKDDKHNEQRERPIHTMAVDGTHLFYYEPFTEALTTDLAMAILAHEVLHCALLHCPRGVGKDAELWNIACDMSVNSILFQDGIYLPEWSIAPDMENKTVEELYADVCKKEKKMRKKYGHLANDVRDPGTEGEDGDGEGNNPIDRSGGRQDKSGLTEQNWKDIISKCRGCQPKSMDRFVEAAMAPTVNWREVLAQFCSAKVRDDEHTWNRISRRYPGLPGWKRQPKANIGVVIDTSGSVDGTMIGTFLAELKSIIDIAGMEVTLIVADADVHQVVEPGEDIPQTLHGGGGTDFRPAVEKCNELLLDGIVYLTDGLGTFPQTSDCPILWAILGLHSIETPPVGDVLRIGNDS